MGSSDQIFDSEDPLTFGDNRGAYFDGKAFIVVQNMVDVAVEKAFTILVWAKGLPGTYISHRSQNFASPTHVRLSATGNGVAFQADSGRVV
jgi:hypothetical protein